MHSLGRTCENPIRALSAHRLTSHSFRCIDSHHPIDTTDVKLIQDLKMLWPMALHAACNGPNIVEDPHVKFLENHRFDEAREVADAVISLEIAWCIFRKLFSGSNTLNTCSQWNITITNCIWMFPKIVVPPNRPILIGFSIINHRFWGTPIFGNTHIYLWFRQTIYI